MSFGKRRRKKKKKRLEFLTAVSRHRCCVYQQEPTYNENIDRLYNKVYAPQLETEDGLYETLMPEDCPPGKVPYKGECIDEFTVRLLKNRETSAKDDELVAKIQEIEQLKQEEKSGQNQQNFNVKWEQYTKDALKKGNKHKKLEPIFSLSEDMFNQQIQPRIDQFEEYYFEKGSDGKVNFYPKHVISGLIYDQGVRPNEFKKYHGLDFKQIQNEFGSLINIGNPWGAMINIKNVNIVRTHTTVIWTQYEQIQTRMQIIKNTK